MNGTTLMEISAEEMVAAIQYYLNNNLLNTTFVERHKSVVESVRQRTSGRFVIAFISESKARYDEAQASLKTTDAVAKEPHVT